MRRWKSIILPLSKNNIKNNVRKSLRKNGQNLNNVRKSVQNLGDTAKKWCRFFYAKFHLVMKTIEKYTFCLYGTSLAHSLLFRKLREWA